MNDKELLIAAIQDSELYTPTKYKILEALISVSTADYIATASAKYLNKITGASIAAVYTALKDLQTNGIITKVINQSNSYKFDETKLNRIIELYSNKTSSGK